MLNQKKTYFLTGATGLLGSYLTKVLLDNGHKVYALARPKQNKTAKERVVDVLNFWNGNILKEHGKNLLTLDGDITKQGLGLDERYQDIFKNEIEEIFHCAAVTEFNWPLDRIREVNVEGTRNVLVLSLECKKLRKVNYVSSIFVCGDHGGVFSEKDLDVGQSFNNTYAQSKFEAEVMIERFRKRGMWIDVFRPPIIIGESSSGKMISFQRAFYQAIRTWNSELFDDYPGKDNYFFTLVCVDELCKSMSIVSSKAETININYHPFNLEQVSLEKIIDFSSEFLGFKKPKLISTAEFLKMNLTPSEKRLLRYNFFFKDINTEFDSKKTNDFLRQYNFIFSCLSKKIFFNLINHAVESGFMRKR